MEKREKDVERIRREILARGKAASEKYRTLGELDALNEDSRKALEEELQKKKENKAKVLLNTPLDEVENLSIEDKIARDNAKIARRKALRDLILKNK